MKKNPRQNRGFTKVELMICSLALSIFIPLILAIVLASANVWVSEAGALACVKAKYPEVIRSISLERGVFSYAKSTLAYGNNGDQQDFLLDVNVLGNCRVVEELLLVKSAKSTEEAPPVEATSAAPLATDAGVPAQPEAVDGGHAEVSVDDGGQHVIRIQEEPEGLGMTFIVSK